MYNVCMETKTITLRLPEEVVKQMQVLAREHTRSLNGEVLVALKEYLAKYQLDQKATGKG